jgi:uncharacterized protein
MLIVWDEPKRLANIVKHGVDFTAFTLEFFEQSMVVPTKLGRYAAIGRQGARVFFVVFSPLGGEAISIVSARRATRRERGLS